MSCILCGKPHWETGKITDFHYDVPDKYEEYCGIKDMYYRAWVECTSCGVYYAIRNYLLSALDEIYMDGYRSKEFRGETIQETFDRINNLPYGQSENKKRIDYFGSIIGDLQSVLDIGSGFGAFPYGLKEAGFEVDCVEPNRDSVDFIYEKLGMNCLEGFYEDIEIPIKYNVVTLIHVLEHVLNPKSFIEKVSSNLKSNGKLFIEVPDAIEFKYLPADHDEFNSCHTAFYSVPTLYRLLDECGYHMTDIKRIKHTDRNLSRIMVLCNKINQ